MKRYIGLIAPVALLMVAALVVWLVTDVVAERRQRIWNAVAAVEAAQAEPDPNDPLDSGSLWVLDRQLFNLGGTLGNPQLDLLDPNCLTDASIRKLAASGRLCKVLGHQWGLYGVVIEGAERPAFERCALCGQTRDEYDMGKVPPAAFAHFMAYDTTKGRWLWSKTRKGWSWVLYTEEPQP